MTVGETTGMIVGATLGLDYYEGAPVSPMAEPVTITSISGTTIGISATAYPHGGTLTPGYVAIPVSAAWMNQQVRDIINFLAYPPICRLTSSAPPRPSSPRRSPPGHRSPGSPTPSTTSGLELR